MIHFSLYVAEVQTQRPASSSALWYSTAACGVWHEMLGSLPLWVWSVAHSTRIPGIPASLCVECVRERWNLRRCVWSVSWSAGIAGSLYAERWDPCPCSQCPLVALAAVLRFCRARPATPVKQQTSFCLERKISFVYFLLVAC